MSALVVTRDIAERVLSIVDQGLCHGLGNGTPGNMCVEAAVCAAYGLPNSDDPPCVHKKVRSFKIALNDKPWSSNKARAKGLRKIAVAQLGSIDIDGNLFVSKLNEKTIRVMVPIALRAVALLRTSHAASLEQAAVRCEQEGTKDAADAARAAARAAHDASHAAAYAAYAAKAAYAAYAAHDAARSADAAAHAADAAAYAAAYAADASYAASYAAYAANAANAANAARDSILTKSADLAVEVLRELNAPGIEYMDMLIHN